MTARSRQTRQPVALPTKKRGRPTSGKAQEVVAVRLPQETIAFLDQHMTALKRQMPGVRVSRGDAIRHLLAPAMAAQAPQHPPVAVSSPVPFMPKGPSPAPEGAAAPNIPWAPVPVPPVTPLLSIQHAPALVQSADGWSPRNSPAFVQTADGTWSLVTERARVLITPLQVGAKTMWEWDMSLNTPPGSPLQLVAHGYADSEDNAKTAAIDALQRFERGELRPLNQRMADVSDVHLSFADAGQLLVGELIREPYAGRLASTNNGSTWEWAVWHLPTQKILLNDKSSSLEKARQDVVTAINNCIQAQEKQGTPWG